MKAGVFLRFAGMFVLLAAGLVAESQPAGKFHGTAPAGSLYGAYEVRLSPDPGDDPAALAQQLAATYGVRLESGGEPSTVIVLAKEANARLLSNDRRVAFVLPLARNDVRNLPVAVTASGFGAYTYDGSGNITSAGDDTFVYDRFGRVHAATVNKIKQTFTYDRHGNITDIATAQEQGGGIAVGTGNRLANATYDLSGNLRSYHGGTFVYDGLNVVTESRPTNGNRRLYIYTASNERLATVEVLPNGQQQSEWTIRDSAGRVLRRLEKHANGQWSWKEDYIYRGAQLLAAEVPGPEKVRHFHLDHLGTPRLITGNGGAKLAERHYGAFGRGLTTTSSDVHEDLEFTGHERDSFHLDYMHARYYDPMLGRFLSVDPTWESADLRNPQTWNRYSYVSNNPINTTDPDGRCPSCPLYLQEAWILASDPRIAQRAFEFGQRVWNLISFAEQPEGASDSSGTDAATDTAIAPVGITDEVVLYSDGTYDVTDWSAYPSGASPPEGPFKLREGEEYQQARNAADRSNQAAHRNDPSLKGKQIHEVHPVKHGGSPTDPANKIVLSPQQHSQFNVFWNRIQRIVETMQQSLRGTP